MKKSYSMISALVLALIALVSQHALAADSSITLHVPFAFVIAGKAMPPGAYTVETDGSVVSVRGSAGTALVASGPQLADRNSEPGLIFTRRGNTTYLVGVRMSDQARTLGPIALQAR